MPKYTRPVKKTKSGNDPRKWGLEPGVGVEVKKGEGIDKALGRFAKEVQAERNKSMRKKKKKRNK
ncbi:MAG: hypothetical protein ABID38_04170 [Candidatus Diapherotrites archaeon]